ncbi:MAG TPA: histone deacetylase [Solirubrobacteraceae bacterium]|nr:histone deacetylase [Solirubrobacteraceae bacterium]
MAERTALVFDERCVLHSPPPGVPGIPLPDWATVETFERPERLTLSRRVLEGSGVLGHVDELPARFATEDELRLAHTPEHVARVLEAARSEDGVQLGHEAWTGPGTHDAMLLAAGGLLEATAVVLDGRNRNAFGLLRPPGHHAERSEAMGFCLFNNTAIAARWARRERGLARVAIVDWDVHHGNGTEEIFFDDPSVLTISLHQDGLYPAHTGQLEVRGAEGANVNVPLPPSTGDEGYLHAFDEVVAPAVRRFAPDLVLVGAGQDASATDPLGRMSVNTTGYRALTDRVVALADEVCGGRLVVMLEGGYSLMHLPLCNLAILEGLAGLDPIFPADPIGADVPGGLRDVEREAVAAAVAAHDLKGV